jgi:hypothetical protein
MARAFDPFAPIAGMANVVGLRGAHVARFEPSPALDDLDYIIALADDLSGDVDLEDDGSGEPNLGWECHGARGPEVFFEDWTDARIYETRHCLDLETDTGDDEPSLGWTISGNTIGYCDGEGEPSLASIDNLDQSHWASGGTLDHEPWLAELDEVRA